MGLTLAQKTAAWVKATGKTSILQTKPLGKVPCKALYYQKFNTKIIPEVSEVVAKEIESSPLVKYNKDYLRPNIEQIINRNFRNTKEKLLKAYQNQKRIYNNINKAETPEKLSEIIESHHTNLLTEIGKSKAMVTLARKETPEHITYWQNKLTKHTYEFSESVYKSEHIFTIPSTNPEVKKYETLLKEKYGIKFAALSDDLPKAKKILKACEVWTKKGEKLPDEIIISRTMPAVFANGQTLRLQNGKTMVLFSHSKEIQEIFLQLGRYKDKIFNFFNPKRLKRTSTTSQLHLYIHEFAHSIQPKAIIEQKVELPSKYTEIAQQISAYAGGSLEELYAELKALSILKPKKLSKEAEDLLKFLENAK